MPISTNGTVVARFAGALYNQQLSNATYNEVVTWSNTNDLNALLNAVYVRDFSSATDLSVATTIIANLGLTAVAGLDNWLSAQLTAAGSNKGAKIAEILNGFAQTPASDPIYGAAAAAWNNQVTTSQTLSQTAGNAGGSFTTLGTTPAGVTFTLTAGVDTPSLSSGNNVGSGITGDATPANNSYTLGDSIVDASTTDADVLNLTIVGATASAVATVTNIETINLTNTGAGNHTFSNALVTGVKNINAVVAIAADTETVTNIASLATVVGLSGKGNLTATTAASTAGTADTVALALNGAGTSATVRSAVDIGNTNAIEAVTIVATGTNFVNLTAGTANKSITVTGAGALNLAGPANAGLVGDATLAALTFNAAAATGAQTVSFGAGAITATGGSAADTFTFGATLGSTDTVDGGLGNDTVTFALGTAVQANPALTSIETVTADFQAAGTYNASKTTGITTLNLLNTVGSVNEAVTNLAGTATAINFKDGATHGTVNIGYATGAAAAAVITIGTQNSTTAVGAAMTIGATALTNAASVAINSVKDADNTAVVVNTLGTVNVGTATTLTASTGTLAALTLGALTGTAVTKETVTADGGAFIQGAFVGGALTDLVLTSANKAGLTTGAVGTANNATTASKLVNYSVTTGATTAVNMGAIDAATLNTTSVAAVSALKTVTYNLGSAATVTALGAIDATNESGGGNNVGSGVAQMDSIAFTLGADAVIDVTVGAISARSVTAATFTVAAQTAAHATGATLDMDESIGSIAITAGANETFTLTVNGINDITGTELYNLALGTVTATGAGNVAIAGLATGVKSIASINLTGVTGTSEVAASTLFGTSGYTITVGSGGTSATGVSGSDKADIITGGAGADVLLGGAGADEITGGLGIDTITGGAGADTINLTEATSSVDTLKYAESGAANVDVVSGFKAGTDIVSLSIGNIAGTETGTLSNVAGTDIIAAVVAGALTATTVAANAAVAGGTTNLVFLSSVAGTSFATAIGTGTVTGATDTNFTTATESVLTAWYDSNNGQAVVGYIINSSTAAVDVLSSADTFVEVVRVGMVAGDYTSANLIASLSMY